MVNGHALVLWECGKSIKSSTIACNPFSIKHDVYVEKKFSKMCCEFNGVQRFLIGNKIFFFFYLSSKKEANNHSIGPVIII